MKALSLIAGAGAWRRHTARERRSLALPSPGEAVAYLRNTGIGPTVRKLVSAYVAGRQRWYVTREDLTRYTGMEVDPAGLELRYARPDDLPRMQRFTRQHEQTLETWCGAEHYFFLALRDGEAIAYRCLARTPHPLVERWMRLEAHQLYVVDEFTAPEFRRQGITRRMAIAMNPTLLLGGYREVLGIHRIDNDNTIAATRAKGIPTLGTLTRTCVFWIEWYRFQPVAPAPRPASVARPTPRSLPRTHRTAA